MNLVFFNHFHNGDIYHAKEFVRDVSVQLQQPVKFSHQNSPLLLKDLEKIGVTSIPLLNLPHRELFLKDQDDNLYVNTHIGAWFGRGLPYTDECTLRFNMGVWKEIYAALSEMFKRPLLLHSEQIYIPYIDFNQYDIKRIQNFVTFEKRKKVLLCNGPALSGQSDYNGDMSEFVTKWAQMYPNIVFILTKMTPLRMENVCYTDQIIGVQGNDLNEIGYLSTFCDLIIGRNSGPFCFTVNQSNTCDRRKHFISFGCRPTDSFLHGVNTRSRFSFHPLKEISGLEDFLRKSIDGVASLAV